MKKNRRVVYVLPQPSSDGGMTSIVSMFYETGLFSNTKWVHFSTSFTWGINKGVRFLQSIVKKVQFLILLIKSKPAAVFVMSSSNWGFYDKILYCFIAKLCKVPSVFNPVGGYFDQFYNSNFLNKMLIRLSMKIPDRIVVASSYWFKFYTEKFQPQKIVNVPNPVNVSKFIKSEIRSDGPLNVIFISRLAESKGIFELTEIVKMILTESDKFRFIIAGKGELSGYIENELQCYTDKSFVKICGFVSDEDKIKLLSEGHVFLFTSHFEVMPISILEAMAAGLPVISTDVGGVSDIVKTDDNGYLFPPGDVLGISKCLLQLETKLMKLKQMGERSREICQSEFDVHEVLCKHQRIFQEISN